MNEFHILMVDDHPTILSISTISCTADELPTQPQEQNTELNSLDSGGNGTNQQTTPPIKG
uniref:hypothetical protein n=1 Tax=Flavobacterium sp. TaxID=239 RepID=UPI0040497EC7